MDSGTVAIVSAGLHVCALYYTISKTGLPRFQTQCKRGNALTMATSGYFIGGRPVKTKMGSQCSNVLTYN